MSRGKNETDKTIKLHVHIDNVNYKWDIPPDCYFSHDDSVPSATAIHVECLKLTQVADLPHD